MKIAGAVVLFNPNIESLENIKTYLPFLEKLYVMDNSTKPLEFLDQLNAMDKVEIVSLGGNQGIAKALKEACKKAIDEKMEFLLTMDQDSKYPTDDFKYIEKFISQNSLDDVGQIALNFEQNGMAPLKKEKDSVRQISSCITSGTIIVLKNYQKIDGFDEKLFIDLVDFDISFQFEEKGFKTLMFENIFLDHKLGEKKPYKFLWKKGERVFHSPLRYYYMFRNYTYLKTHKSKTYVKLLEKFKKDYDFVARFKFIFSRKKGERLVVFKMMRLGIKHGKKGILGPFKGDEK